MIIETRVQQGAGEITRSLTVKRCGWIACWLSQLFLRRLYHIWSFQSFLCLLRFHHLCKQLSQINIFKAMQLTPCEPISVPAAQVNCFRVSISKNRKRHLIFVWKLHGTGMKVTTFHLYAWLFFDTYIYPNDQLKIDYVNNCFISFFQTPEFDPFWS